MGRHCERSEAISSLGRVGSSKPTGKRQRLGAAGAGGWEGWTIAGFKTAVAGLRSASPVPSHAIRVRGYPCSLERIVHRWPWPLVRF